MTWGDHNSAFGARSLDANLTGNNNAAFGNNSLGANTSGSSNAGFGWGSLQQNTTADPNSALGYNSLGANRTGSGNSAVGYHAAGYNFASDDNSALGRSALGMLGSGSRNVAVGADAGSALTSGADSVSIGSPGVGSENGVIRLGGALHTSAFIAGVSGTTVAGGVPVRVSSAGQLGTLPSSIRFKAAVRDMRDSSRVLMELRRRPRRDAQEWRTSIKNHSHELFACDFMTQYTALFATVYVFVVMEIATRRIVHCNVTESPALDWVKIQLRDIAAFDRKPRFLLRDNDGILSQFGQRKDGFRCHLDRWLSTTMEIERLPTPYQLWIAVCWVCR